MKTFTITAPQKRALSVAVFAAIVLGAYFLRGFFSLIVIAAILVFLFNPIYKRLLRRGHSPSRASTLTLLTSFIVIIIPVSLIIVLSAFQIDRYLSQFSSAIQELDPSKVGHALIDAINNFLAKIPFVTYRVTVDTLTDTLNTVISKVGSSMLSLLKQAIPGFIGLITQSITYIFVFLSLLRNQDKLLELFRRLNPLGKQISDLYLSKTSAMVKGTVRGQFTIALVQGFTDALLITLGGLHGTFFFFFIILTALSIIPLGGGILAIPVGIGMMLFGNFWGGLLVILGHLFITTNEDNILRPKLVPKSAKLDSALMLLSVFSGVALFGFLGIVIGPVIMVIIVTTVQVYLEVFQNYKLVEEPTAEGGHTSSSSAVFSKVKQWTRKLKPDTPEESN